MEKVEERDNKVTLVILLQDLGKDLGRRPSLQSTYLYIVIFLNFLIEDILDFSLYPIFHISLCIHW
jgi:hypothetical protein